MAQPTNPTIYTSQPEAPVTAFDPSGDVDALHKSMKGLGTDDKVLSNIIATRSRAQLQVIKQAFEKKHGKSLASWIKGDTSGQYQDLLLALVEDKYEYDAKLVNHAIKGLGTNDEELIEVLCTRTNAELAGMKQAYQKLFKVDVEKDISGDTSGDYKNLLLAIVRADRNENTNVNVEEARADAEALYKAGEGKVGTNEKVFIDVLTKKSFPHLLAVNQIYSQKTGHSLERAIEKETSFNFGKALTVLITPRDEYFAHQIHKSIEGAGTEDQKLIRNLSFLSSNPVLMKAVNSWYMHKWNHNIVKDVAGDTSGWYKKTAEALVRNRVDL
eukprot:TRINITY_DN688_c0_g1_i1.p1 TRINITY_DN688_c0_g1~~TRINITY_DN688_c0_g1_i1.p1  ORF type:complete len:328 (+),score=109.97 TRINITY_DN688_c0_g1_i1:136-1119(+)